MSCYFASFVLFVASGLWATRYFRSSSSLSKIPNAHFIAPYSSLWLLWLKLTGWEHRTRDAAHKRFGPIIRIAPRDLSVNCIEDGVQTIYGGAFEKTDWYSNFKNYGQHFMFSITANKPHSERRRMLAHVYSKTHIQNSVALNTILDTVLLKRLLPKLREWAEGGCAVNVNLENKAIFMDIMTAYLFGLEDSTNFIENQEEKDLLKGFEPSTSGLFWFSDFPRTAVLLNRLRESVFGDLARYFRITEYLGLTRLIEQLRIPVLADTIRSWESVEKFALDLCQRAKARPPSTIESSPQATVYSRYQERLEASQTVPSKLRDITVAAEMVDEIQAGHEATGITITFLMWELSRHPKARARLQQELDILGPSCSPHDIDNLPFLDALLMESMRLYPAGFGPFPRRVPVKGAMIGGFDIPPGITVSASPHTLHRNPDVFPEPEIWRPERWVDATEEQKKEMSRWFWAFGSGSRMCIGNHLAIRTMKASIVAIYSEFETFTVNSDIIQQMDGLMGTPVGNKVMLRFAERTRK